MAVVSLFTRKVSPLNYSCHLSSAKPTRTISLSLSLSLFFFLSSCYDD